MWNEVSLSLTERGYTFTGDQCDSKFRNLKKTYKRIRDNNKSTGRGSINWAYFSFFEEVFGHSADIEPIAIASNMSGVKIQSEIDPKPSTSTHKDNVSSFKEQR